MPGSDSAIRLQFIKETQIGIANTKLSEVYYFAGSYPHNLVGSIYARAS